MLARVLRIFPPLFAAVAITLGAVLIIQGFGLYGSETYLMPGDEASARAKATFEWSNVWSTLALTYSLVPGHGFLMFNGPLWSLSLGAVMLGAWMLLVSRPVPPFWSVAAVWWIGFAAGWWWPQMQGIRASRLVFLGIGSLLLATLVGGNRVPEFLVSAYSSTRQNLFYVIVSTAVLSAIILLITRGGQPYRWLVRVGGYSYTLYLVHFPLMLFSTSLFRPALAPLGIPGQILLALGTFLAVIFVSDRLALIVENRRLARSIVGKLYPGKDERAGDELPWVRPTPASYRPGGPPSHENWPDRG